MANKTAAKKTAKRRTPIADPDETIISQADRYEAIMRANLIVIAQTYADGMGWSLATVSKQIHGNQAFFLKFSAGEVSTSVRTYFVMVDKFKANWPPQIPWPKTIPVPELGKNIAN